MTADVFQGVDYRRLVEAAILAPSPDNNQPWLFAVEDHRLVLRADARYALPSDKDDLFCWMSIGAAAENVRIAAREQGYEASLKIESGDTYQKRSGVPEIAFTFAPANSVDPLYQHLTARCTSRKLYTKRGLAPETLECLASAASTFAGAKVDWIVERHELRRLAWLVGATDRVRFEYQPFHEELFKQLRLTVAEAEKTRDGLDLRTLELPPGAPLLLRMLRSWTRMQWLHRLGVGRTLSLPSVMSVLCSGAVGALSMTERSPEQYLQAGQALQRLWLTAASQGLSLQPMGSLAIFMAHLEDQAACPLAAAHQDRLQRIVRRFHILVPAGVDRKLVMLFRIGRGHPVKVRSLRRTADSFLR